MEDKLKKFNEERKLYNKRNSKDANRERLKNYIKKLMTTIIVGSIDEMEQYFGEVWGHGIDKVDKTDSELDMNAVWTQCRNKIFDRGNLQIRNMFKELDSYEVELIRHLTIFQKDRTNEEV